MVLWLRCDILLCMLKVTLTHCDWSPLGGAACRKCLGVKRCTWLLLGLFCISDEGWFHGWQWEKPLGEILSMPVNGHTQLRSVLLFPGSLGEPTTHLWWRERRVRVSRSSSRVSQEAPLLKGPTASQELVQDLRSKPLPGEVVFSSVQWASRWLSGVGTWHLRKPLSLGEGKTAVSSSSSDVWWFEPQTSNSLLLWQSTPLPFLSHTFHKAELTNLVLKG